MHSIELIVTFISKTLFLRVNKFANINENRCRKNFRINGILLKDIYCQRFKPRPSQLELNIGKVNLKNR